MPLAAADHALAQGFKILRTPLLGARLVCSRLVSRAAAAIEQRVAEGDVGLLGRREGGSLRSACRLPTEGSTVTGCFSASQAASR